MELWPQDRNPYDAFLAQQPLYEVTTGQTQIVYGMAEPALIPGRKYAWQVQAQDLDGRDLFKNQGKSEIHVFQYGNALATPGNLQLQHSSSSSLNLAWEQTGISAMDPLQYRVRYRPKNGDQWYEDVTTDMYRILGSLQPSTEYEVQVRGENGLFSSDYTVIQTFSTLEPNENQFVCNSDAVPPPMPEAGFPDRPLGVNDTIHAGGYDVLVKEVVQTGNTYTGKGVVIVPWFNLAKVAVTFENIEVNPAHWLTSGKIETIWNADSPFLLQFEGKTPEDGVTPILGELPVTLIETDSLIEITGTSLVTVTKDSQGNYIVQTSDGGSVILPASTEQGPASYSITDELGNGYVIDEKGNITKTTSDQALAARERGNRNYDLVLEFEKGDGKYGFDKKSQEVLSDYYQEIDGGHDVAWKALPEGKNDSDIVVSTGLPPGLDAEGMVFEQGSDPVAVRIEGGRFVVPLRGGTEGMAEELVVYTDATKETVAGKLNLLSYKPLNKKLVLVPVNGNAYPHSVGSLTDGLNGIYSQALVNWTVEVDDNLQVALSDSTFDDGESDFLSTYTGDMKAVIRAYQADHTFEKDTYYLFLVSNPQNPGKAGFMPRSKQAGFLFVDNLGEEQEACQIAAHELGHGAFGLQHPFLEFPGYQSDGNNLMDYPPGNKLYRHQWDQIHNPPVVLPLFDDEEEGAYNRYQYMIYGSIVTFRGSFSKYAGTSSAYSFISRAGKLISLPSDVEDVSFLKSSGTIAAFTITNSDGQAVRYASAEWPISGDFAGYRSNTIKTETKLKANLYLDEISKTISSPAEVYLGLAASEDCKIQLYKGSIEHNTPKTDYYAGLNQPMDETVAGNLSKEVAGDPIAAPESCLCLKGRDFFNLFSSVITSEEEFNQLYTLADNICKLPEGFLSAYKVENDAAFHDQLNQWLMWESDKVRLIQNRKDFWDREDAWNIYQTRLNQFINRYHNYKTQFDDGTISNRTLKAIINALSDEFIALYSIEERIDIIKALLPEKSGMSVQVHYGAGGPSADYSEIYVDDAEEHAIINVLKSVKTKADAAAMLNAISSDGFLSVLNYHLDDFGLGGNNFSKLAQQFHRLTLLAYDIPEKSENQTISHWGLVHEYNPDAHFVYNDNRTFSFGVPATAGGVLYKNVEYDANGLLTIEKEVCEEIEDFDRYYYTSPGTPPITQTAQKCVKSTPSTHYLKYFDLITIDIIDVDYIPYEATDKLGSSIITYAGFIDYLLEKKGTDQAIKIADYTITTASLAFGVGELSIMLRAGASTARIALASSDIGLELTDLIVNSDAFAGEICGYDENGIPKNCERLREIRAFNALAQIAAISASGFDIAKNWKNIRKINWDDASLAAYTHVNNLSAPTKSRLGSILNSVPDDEIPTILAKLDDDLGNIKYNIKELLDESPGDIEIWKQLTDDPSYAWEISKTGDARWQKWSQREFFKDVTELGKKFETETVLNALKARNSNPDYLALKDKFPNKNLDEYDMYSQVQLSFDEVTLPSGKKINYFTADQVFIKWGKKADGVTDEVKDIIVIENKLTDATSLTPNQNAGKASSELTVRSINQGAPVSSRLTGGEEGLSLPQGTEIGVQAEWVKIHDGETGDVISGINKL
ncbi:MAG: fibronectin type III domain-containing protein [Cyclobacteriaceae bacterium]|nr:fibronectin type III domain-containing protein [Cyclobacteriaceae bacterium]